MTRQVSSKIQEHWMGVLMSLFALAFVFALSTTPVWGQATATINGTVRDSAGAVVTDATVLLHNRDTNLDRTAVTNSVGAYVMPDVQPGNYDLKVTKNGFGPIVRSGILLVSTRLQPTTLRSRRERLVKSSMCKPAQLRWRPQLPNSASRL